VSTLKNAHIESYYTRRLELVGPTSPSTRKVGISKGGFIESLFAWVLALRRIAERGGSVGAEIQRLG
jgi:hypothetical protein